MSEQTSSAVPGGAFTPEERETFNLLQAAVRRKVLLLTRCHTVEGDTPKAVVTVRTVQKDGRHVYSPLAVLLSPDEAKATLKPTFLKELREMAERPPPKEGQVSS